jgi:hypothetical protein
LVTILLIYFKIINKGLVMTNLIYSYGRQIISEGLQAFRYGWNHYILPQQQILRNRLNQYLTPQQQMIAAIALAALSSLAAVYLISRCIRKHQVKEEKDEMANIEVKLSPISEEVIQLEINESRPPQVEKNSIKEKSFTGFGSITFPDGEKWEGGFERGLLQGNGQIGFADGRILKGEFEEGRLVGSIQMTFPEGDMWKGRVECENQCEEVILFPVDSAVEEREEAHKEIEGQERAIGSEPYTINHDDGEEEQPLNHDAPLHDHDKEDEKGNTLGYVASSPKEGRVEEAKDQQKTPLKIAERREGQPSLVDHEASIEDGETLSKIDLEQVNSTPEKANDLLTTIFPASAEEQQKEKEPFAAPADPSVNDGSEEQQNFPQAKENVTSRRTEETTVPIADSVLEQAREMEEQKINKEEVLIKATSPEKEKKAQLQVKGDFSPNKKNGTGTIVWPDGSIFEGDFTNGLLHCRFGRVKLVDGTQKEGEFKEGQLNGFGKKIFANGDWQTGEFKDDLLNGQGTRRHMKEGVEYISTGNFQNGALNGQGTMQYTKDGQELVCVGNYMNDVLDDRGNRILSPPRKTGRTPSKTQPLDVKGSPQQQNKMKSPKQKPESSPVINTFMRLFGRKPKVKGNGKLNNEEK